MDLAFARAVAALRLSFSGHSRRATGENLQAPRLFAQPKNGYRHAQSELDDLLFTEKGLAGAGGKSEMSSGLRPIRSELQS